MFRSLFRGVRCPAAALVARRTARNAAPTEASSVMANPADSAIGPKT